MEAGKVDTRASHIIALAHALGVSADYLLGLKDDRRIRKAAEAA
jgi:hypothetical protein